MRTRGMLVLAALAAAALLTVGCDAGAGFDGAPEWEMDGSADKSVAMVNFGIPKAKTLESNLVARMIDSLVVENLYWRYTATKADQIGLKSGEKTAETDVKTTDGLPVPGLDQDIGPLSLGKWDFELFGYLDAAHTKKVLYGKLEEKSVSAGSVSQQININVNPVLGQDGTLTVKGDITLEDLGAHPISGAYKREIKVTKLPGGSPQTKTEEVGANPVGGHATNQEFGVPAGDYRVDIKYFDKEDPSLVYGKGQITVRVWSNVETEISGDLGELTQSVNFKNSTITGYNAT